MKLFILGICGTFMGGIALIAKQLGHDVAGCDANIYPPMSDTLQQAGINILPDFEAHYLDQTYDCIIVGNRMARGKPIVEAMLNKNCVYRSGPQWLFENVLQHRHVLAVSGTHGKTTTTSLLTWILHEAGLNPGFLIGGVCQHFANSADAGQDPYFVIEADEYDTAFFDKRSKFMHYHPRTLVINNLEYDHADIFADLAAIKQQFQFLLRTVPAAGTVIYPANDANVSDVIQQGCWASQQLLQNNNGWQAKLLADDGSRFEIHHRDQKLATVNWSQVGSFNVQNALAATAAANDIGIGMNTIVKALQSFQGVKRRLELSGVVNQIAVYDDFAHHPTAIAATLQALRNKVGQQRIIAALQLGSNTMRLGTHKDKLLDALRHADATYILRPEDAQWNVDSLATSLRGAQPRGNQDIMGTNIQLCDSVDAIVSQISQHARSNDHILVMSNKGFGGIHQKLLEQLQKAASGVSS